MFQLTLENERGKQLILHPSTQYVVTNIQGLTPPTATINSSVVALQDGEVYNSARANTRNIVISVKPQPDVEKNRIALYDVAKTKHWCKLYFKSDTRDVYIEGYIESVEGSLFEMSQEIQISILCHQPYFVAMETIITEMSKTLDLFEFPFAIEKEGIEISRVEDDLVKTIINSGDVETGIIIEMLASGNVVNPTIYNADTRGSFGLNITLQMGDKVTINTTPGNKSVILTRYGIERNIVNNITKNPEWFKLLPGENTFTYSCQDGEELLSVRYLCESKFEGV